MTISVRAASVCAVVALVALLGVTTVDANVPKAFRIIGTPQVRLRPIVPDIAPYKKPYSAIGSINPTTRRVTYERVYTPSSGSSGIAPRESSFRDIVKDQLEDAAIETAVDLLAELAGLETDGQPADKFDFREAVAAAGITADNWRDMVASVEVQPKVRVWTNNRALCSNPPSSLGNFMSLGEMRSMIGEDEIMLAYKNCGPPGRTQCNLVLGLGVRDGGTVYTVRTELPQYTSASSNSGQCIVNRIEDFPNEQYLRISSSCSTDIFSWSNSANTYRAARCANNGINTSQKPETGCSSTVANDLCVIKSDESVIVAQLSASIATYGLSSQMCMFEVPFEGDECALETAYPEVTAKIMELAPEGGSSAGAAVAPGVLTAGILSVAAAALAFSQ